MHQIFRYDSYNQANGLLECGLELRSFLQYKGMEIIISKILPK